MSTSGKRLDPALPIGRANDALERDADRAAHAALENGTNVRPAAGHERMPDVKRSEIAPESATRALDATGASLAPALRSEMEARFDHDFSRVRVHCGESAARAADDVDAKAYTVGRDIVFGAGRYDPGSRAGRRLVAHELAHVVQQEGAEPVLQRVPTFPDDTCSPGRQKKITERVAEALELVRDAIGKLKDPAKIAGPLHRFFKIDADDPTHVATLIPTLEANLIWIRTMLEADVPAHCEVMPGARASTNIDATSAPVLADGVTYSMNMILHDAMVDTIVHEYAHLAGFRHGARPGKDPTNFGSVRVIGLSTERAFDNAESYARFVRAVNR